MIIIPAIDIIQGKVVRLHQGDFNKEKFYSDDPVKIASMWRREGAEFLHIVDLDGARLGKMKNRDTIIRIIKSVDIPCEIGGGLREEKDIEFLLKQGANRVVLGTKALEDRPYLEQLISSLGDKILISVDFAGDKVMKKGWQEQTCESLDDCLIDMQRLGIKRLVVTDITIDGTLRGPNIERLKELLSAVDILIVVSGGVSSVEDIKRLKAIGNRNLEAVIIGRALYEGKIDLKEAIEIARL